ncbi:MAG TPA: hypothetical protein VMV49_18535 [Candidatus Deferrimicrobium sp.]|jgi:hypothetical protein|nr:hypothetical protein [Candidatus Deferrimicrobium sp.]
MASYEETEPPKGLRIAGGVISIVCGGIIAVIFVFFLFVGGLLSIIAIIFGEPGLLLLLFCSPVLIAGAVLLFTGGLLGLLKVARVGAILALIGSILVIIFNFFSYKLLIGYAGTGLEFFLTAAIIIIPLSIIGVIGSVLLFIALRRS